MEAYRRLRHDGGPDYRMLFWLPSQLRETYLRRYLTSASRAAT